MPRELEGGSGAHGLGGVPRAGDWVRAEDVRDEAHLSESRALQLDGHEELVGHSTGAPRRRRHRRRRGERGERRTVEAARGGSRRVGIAVSLWGPREERDGSTRSLRKCTLLLTQQVGPARGGNGPMNISGPHTSVTYSSDKDRQDAPAEASHWHVGPGDEA